MELVHKHIQNIVEANNNNRLAIFIGAGISKSSETETNKIPLWSDLINELKSDLGTKNETDFLKIAQLYFLEFDEYTYYSKIKNFFPNNLEPSHLHKIIFELQPQIVITTNWDCLLEKSIEKNAFIYEVIKSDKDLVKSTLQKKLIKIHGDFSQHNFVLKEDDYLNYSTNFPIMENYIKSILCTHTVVFLGYSFSDMDLKHIVKWIQTNSSVRPPAYIVTFSSNLTQQKYLENFGIKSIVLNYDKNKTLFDMDAYSSIIYDFLKQIKDKNIFLNETLTDEQVLNSIYNKISPFNYLESILIDQIVEILEVNIIYFNEIVIIEFYKNIELYSKFVEILIGINNYPNYDKIKMIFRILDKAGIGGIVLSENEKGKQILVLSDHIKSEYYSQISNHINFDYKIPNEYRSNINTLLTYANTYFQLGMFEKAYNLTEEIISIELKSKNYVNLFSAMFDRNVALRILQNDIRDKDYIKYDDFILYDLDEKYTELPKDIRKSIKPIYDFINFNYIYKHIYIILEELKKKENSINIIKQGGMVLSSNTNKNFFHHTNLVLYVLKNNLTIETFQEFKIINETYIKIALLRQTQQDTVTLTKIELYCCIKYINMDVLEILLDDFTQTNEDNRRFLLDKDMQEWLILALKNSLYSKALFESYFNKIVFILSLSELLSETNEVLLGLFFEALKEMNNSIFLFSVINDFLGRQYILYKAPINAEILVKMVELILNNIIYKRYNRRDLNKLILNPLYNLYGYIQQNKSLFNNKILVEKFLLELKSWPETDQFAMVEKFLIDLYDISDGNSQESIKEFILNYKLPKDNKDIRIVTFNILLVLKEFINADDNLLNNLDEILKIYENNHNFSGIFYSLDNYLEYLVNEKKDERFLPFLKRIKDLLEFSPFGKFNSII